ncbi:hypothetical protein EVB67_017 [Rhizobium phage RHph_TM3_3_14B]|nr:hypothetical protein EVB67_017 [Rhizobium phage RHph_TM3_3_14B]
MRRLVIQPEGWPCSYEECRPGFFVLDGDLFLKSEYGGDGYCSSGEAFALRNSEVQPVTYTWEVYEE